MDILIKGMEMPKSCYSDEFKYCPFLFFDYNTKSHCELSDDIRCTKTRRPKGCPLVEVPPHGRLVDADKLFNECEQFDLPNVMPDSLWYEARDLLNAPTVLEAST